MGTRTHDASEIESVHLEEPVAAVKHAMKPWRHGQSQSPMEIDGSHTVVCDVTASYLTQDEVLTTGGFRRVFACSGRKIRAETSKVLTPHLISKRCWRQC